MGQPAFITRVIHQHGWRQFCQHPSNPIVPLVREFYANLLDFNQETVFVQNVKVPFTARAINSIFGLEEVVDEYVDFASEVTDEQLEVVLAEVAIEGATWQISPQGAYTCIRKELKRHAQIWYHFLTARFMPSTHGKTVAKDRVLLLYSILTGISVNIEEITIKEIKACSAARKRGGLYFPSLITQLWLKANVPYHKDEAIVHNAGAISTLSISRISQGRAVNATKGEAARDGAGSSGQGTTTTTSGTVSPEIAQSLRLLEQRMSLQEIQQYEIQGLLGHMEAQQRQY
ncbi:hypothetical protein L484_022412 [Morus notabilis]|uniref:Putative plant transposon protein domain-containing protein n=1 Tax=Morus notabilis TaxID=981085 RepID=W9QTD9_9ROSA|nr:hypothetical protein L484_022412 [Morus notabilis]